MPGDEASLLALSGARDRIEGLARSGLPPQDILVRSLEKNHQLVVAAEAGLRVPASELCDDTAGALMAARQFGYPLLLKPARSQIPTPGGLRYQKSLLVASEGELQAAMSRTGSPFLAQAAVPGGTVFSCSGVYAGGALRAVSFASDRRTWPRGAGSASFAQTLPIPGPLVERVGRFVDLVGYSGPFEVEFVGTTPVDARFIDFNPRIYGSLAMAVAAGANLPAVWCDWLLGRTGPPQRARPAVCYRWEEGEMKNLIHSLRRRRVREALEIVYPRRQVVHAVFRHDDPGPFLSLLAYIVQRRARRIAPIDHLDSRQRQSRTAGARAARRIGRPPGQYRAGGTQGADERPRRGLTAGASAPSGRTRCRGPAATPRRRGR